MGVLKLVSFLLVFCFIGWVVSIFAARLLAWLLSQLMPASVAFEVAGCNSLRDITIKFRKGSIEFVSIGEVKLTFARSLIKKGSNCLYSHPKLQLVACDIEIIMKKSDSSNKKRKSRASNPKGKRKLFIIIANIARFMSVSIRDIVVKELRVHYHVLDV
ncbi:hypothetical protein HPP92_018504 [Vanilla planifolia]|uniref:Uncharacterized protein n=1 Tax=Vanilla planifolia TaxID=51239 RepID=A0A835Q756_VANPL|nr:hypothetical protein HPP92_018504 [Vanilla planifolia]